MKHKFTNLLTVIAIAAIAAIIAVGSSTAAPAMFESPFTGISAGFWPVVADSRIAETLLSSWVDVGAQYRITFAGNWVDAGSMICFEAVLSHPESGKSMLAKLQYWDGSNWVDVSGSQVSTFYGQLRRYRSGVIAVPTDEKEYRIVIDGNGVSKSGYLWRASILVIPLTGSLATGMNAVFLPYIHKTWIWTG